jgi:hypothetical protein
MKEIEARLMEFIKASRPNGFFLNDASFHVSQEFNPSLNNKPIHFEADNSIIGNFIKFEADVEGDGKLHFIRFFTDHRIKLFINKDLKNLETAKDEAQATPVPVAEAQVIIAAEYQLLSNIEDDSIFALFGNHQVMFQAYPYARELLQNSFARAGITNITLPYLIPRASSSGELPEEELT